MSLLVPKNRRPKFIVHLSIQDLTNIPLVSGLVHVRWHLRDSIRSEARGKTDRSAIKDHKVEWGYENSWTAKMVIDKLNRLQDAIIVFEVYQEMYGGKERHALGKLDLNLAEYAEGSEGAAQRYLLQNSKVNSTLRLGLYLEQISGDTNFTAPEMRKAQVFGGITGLLGEGKEIKKRDDDIGYTQNDDAVVEKVALEFEQDIYRNSMTRRWQEQAGELDPADVIDDIFNGGDGWVRPYKEDIRTHRQNRRRPESFDTNDMSSVDRSREYERLSSTNREEVPDNAEVELQRLHWLASHQVYESDEMLRSLAWSIDSAQVEHHVNKSLDQRMEDLVS